MPRRPLRRVPTRPSKTAAWVAGLMVASTATVVVGNANATVVPGAAYWTVSATGTVTGHGGAATYGSLPARTDGPVVAMAATPDGGGYWLANGRGGVFAFGDAKNYGSMARTRLHRPVVGMAATPDGGGYWLVASDGGIFAFGDAQYHGSTGALRLRSPIVGMAADPTGTGYWLVARDGGVFSFGTGFYGSGASHAAHADFVGMATTPDGRGYWLASSAGKVISFGDAGRYGSAPAHLPSPVVAIGATPDGGGYWLAERAGGVLGLGDAAAVKLGASGRPATLAALVASAAIGYLGSGVIGRSSVPQAPATTSAPATATSTSPSPVPNGGGAGAVPTVSLGAGSNGTIPSPALTPTQPSASGSPGTTAPSASTTATVPGQLYQICDGTSPTGAQFAPGSPAAKYLTSPWTYDALASGSRTYTISEYEALPGYGSALPPLPAYIADEPNPTTTVGAVIYAPGQSVYIPGYEQPAGPDPVLTFFEGGAYGSIGTPAVSGALFIGGSAPGYAEPAFNDGGDATGVSASTSTFGFSGGRDNGSGTAGSSTVTVVAGGEMPGSYVTFADGTNYHVTAVSGTILTVSPVLSATESSTELWYNNANHLNGGYNQIAELTEAAAPGATQVTVGGWSGGATNQPIVAGEALYIGAEPYEVTSIAGSQRTGYMLTLGSPIGRGLGPGAPVWYSDTAGGVTVEYLNIANDIHYTTATLTAGAGWTIEHDYIHDGYAGGLQYATTNAAGIAISAGDHTTAEYDCFARMGEYAWNGGGVGSVFDYNEVTNTPYNPDLSGNGQTGIGKWWGSLNNDVIDNSLIADKGSLWFDNGNTGQLVEGNFFYQDPSRVLHNETGYNSAYVDNLFEDVDQALYMNSSGGWDIPGSRYLNASNGCQSGVTNGCIIVRNNIFDNVRIAVDIWQSSGRSTLNSGEAIPGTGVLTGSANYAADGFPNNQTATGTSNSPVTTTGTFYASHYSDSNTGSPWTVIGNQTCTSTNPCGTATHPLVLSGGTGSYSSPVLNDWIGFSSEATTTTMDKTDVSTFTGSGTINATTTSFPASGQLLVATTSGSTWAVVSYQATTATQFQQVSLVRGSGTLSGLISDVQPYQVTAINCPGGNCVNNDQLELSPPITSSVMAGTHVFNTGTCRYYLPGSSPSGPLDPSGHPYWDDCQWQTRNIQVFGNTFIMNASQMNATIFPWGGTWGSSAYACTTGVGGNCGQVLMGYQYNNGLTPTFQGNIESNAMMSIPSLSGLMTNLNAGDSPLVGASTGVASNDEAPYNDLFSQNTYSGPWTFNAYNQAVDCGVRWTQAGLAYAGSGGDACGLLTLGEWQKYWAQDAGSSGS